MKYRLVAAAGVTLAIIHSQAFLGAANQPLPVRNGRPVVATVNDDAISLDEFVMHLGTPGERSRLRQGRGTAKDLELLDRLITIKLIVQEATTMGLDEAPEIRKQIDVSSREILREVLIGRLVKDVRPDPAAVEKLFQDMVREWKTASLLFTDEAAAAAARKELGNGAAFADVAAKVVAAKTAKADTDNAYHPKKDYLPQIGDAIARLRVGQVSPVVRLQSGFVIVKVVDLRYPENPDARAEARKQVLSQQQLAALMVHERASRRRYAVVNEAVLKSVDYEAARPGVDALLKDKTVIAQIKGASPITVGDLTEYVRLQFFHGTDQAKQRQEMNTKKDAAFDAMLGRRLLNMEAQKLAIDRTNAYRDRLNGYRDSLVFDSFVQKVIVPENKMREEEVKGHYSGHLDEYSYPGMFRVRSLAFAGRGAAEGAMRRLREGTDYGWLAANADGQVAKGAPGLLEFDGRPVTADSMPAAVQKALAGSKAGEFRLYASPEGHFYILAVQQVIASTPKPYDEVRQDIAKKLYGEKLKKSVREYAEKLQAHSKVETYLKKVQ